MAALGVLIAWDLSLSVRLHVDELAALFAGGENHYAVNESVNGVIFAHTYVEAGMMHCATLTFDDVTGTAVAAAKDFNAEAFAF